MSQSTAVKKRMLSLGVGLTAGALALTGCAEGGAASGGEELTGSPINIGLVTTESGNYSDGGGAAAAAARAWQSLVNETGGIGGHPVNVQIEDSQTTAPGGTAAADRVLANDDNVIMILSDLASEIQISEHIKSTGTDIPVISGGGSDPVPWATEPGFFQPGSGSPMIVDFNVHASYNAGATNLGYAYCQEAASCAEHIPRLEPIAEGLGMTNSAALSVSSTAANYTAECLGWIEQGVDSIVLILPIQTSARLMADCLQQGYEGIFSVSGAFDADYVDQAPGATVVGGITGFAWWADDPAVERYREAMTKYEPNSSFTNSQATATWATLELFRKAIGENPGDLTRADVFDALNAVTDEMLDGLLPGPVTFTEGEPSPVINCMWSLTYTAGDDNVTSITPTAEESGNGRTDELGTVCGDS